MNILGAIFGEGASKPIEAVGGLLDDLFTSDEERLDKRALLDRIAQKPGELQAMINKTEAAHRSVFVAGWRPFIGWTCGISLFFYFVPQYIMATILWVKMSWAAQAIAPYPVSADAVLELVIAMLGMAVIRGVEKARGLTK